MKRSFASIVTVIGVLACVGLCVLTGCAESSPQGALSAQEGNASEQLNMSDSNTSHKVHKLRIYAASSLQKAMNEVQGLYTEKYPDCAFEETHFDSADKLNALLEEGRGKPDIEIIDSKRSMDEAETAGYIDPTTRVTMFKNDLFMVASVDNTDINEVTLNDIATGTYRLALCSDETSSKHYTNRALRSVGCCKDESSEQSEEGATESVSAYLDTPLEGKVVLASSVENVCKCVESQQADIAFLSSGDVERFSGVKIVGKVPREAYGDISYLGAVCAKSENAQEARDFLDWCLNDADALKIWQKWGFELVA